MPPRRLKMNYSCKGQPFTSRRSAYEAMEMEWRACQMSRVMEQPTVFFCTEGHYHYRLIVIEYG